MRLPFVLKDLARSGAVLLLALQTGEALAGAWTLERGETKLFVTSVFTHADERFDGDGTRVTVPEYRKIDLSGTLEYGFRPWLTLLARGNLKEERSGPNGLPAPDALPARSFGAVSGGARVRLWQGPHWVTSTEVSAFSGDFDSAGRSNPSGSAAVEARGNVGIGGNALNRPVFADLSAGYRAHLDRDDPDEVKLDLTLGARVLPRWQVLAQSFSTFLVNGDANYHKVAGSVVFSARPSFKVEVGGVATVAGRNAVREVGGRVGFWYAFGGYRPDRPMAGR